MTHDLQDLIIPKNDTKQNMTQQQSEYGDYDETSMNQATLDTIVRSRILGLFILHNIISKMKQDEENATEEHQVTNNRIIIIDYRAIPNKPETNAINSVAQVYNKN